MTTWHDICIWEGISTKYFYLLNCLWPSKIFHSMFIPVCEEEEFFCLNSLVRVSLLHLWKSGIWNEKLSRKKFGHFQNCLKSTKTGLGKGMISKNIVIDINVPSSWEDWNDKILRILRLIRKPFFSCVFMSDSVVVI